MNWDQDIDEREAEWEQAAQISHREGLAILARLAVTGSVSAPPPIRRRYGRDLLGLLGIITIALGVVALGML